MKKLFSVLIALLIITTTILPLSACSEDEGLVLNVYNWEDYIACEDYDMIAEFESFYEEEYGKQVTINYSTFGTCENMYNELKLTQKKNGDYSYDLVCPSDYMIQKMILEGMLEKFDVEDGYYTKMPNYSDNTSDFILDLFSSSGWNEYATCYNWGTMGFTYNDEYVDEEDVKSWAVAWQDEYRNRVTIKDSVRDSYILAIGYVFKDELLRLKEEYKDDLLSPEYAESLNGLFNDFSDETQSKVQKAFTDLKQNVYGFEVDSGKQDMATGKLWINFAWSGDAVYAMDIAEEYGAELKYVVPEEGSNIFFDGWVMPKGANVELAQEFLNFMYREDNAIENLDYICYSSPIVGNDVFDYVCSTYGASTLVEVENTDDYDEEELIECNGKYYVYDYVGYNLELDGENEYLISYYDEETEEIIQEETTLYPYSVKDFFGEHLDGDGIIYTDNLSRQLVAMYPDSDTRARCVVMQHIETPTLKKLNNMWDSVKVGYMSPTLMIIIVVILLVVIIALATIHIIIKKGVKLEPKYLKDLKFVKTQRLK